MSAKAIGRLMALAILLTGVRVANAQQKADKSTLPNILVIMGDDIGFWNLSSYNQGDDGLSDAQHRQHRQ